MSPSDNIPKKFRWFCQKQFVEATCCHEQDVVQDVAFCDSRADTNYLKWHNQPRARPHVEGWKRSVHSQRGTTKIRDGAYAPHFSRSHNKRAAELAEKKNTQQPGGCEFSAFSASSSCPPSRRKSLFASGLWRRATLTRAARGTPAERKMFLSLCLRHVRKGSLPLYCNECAVRIFTVPLMDSPGP